MNELDLLSRLGAKARDESLPPFDVTAKVIAQISRRPARAVDSRLAAVAICACSLSALAFAAAWLIRPAHDTVATLSEAAESSTGADALWRLLEP